MLHQKIKIINVFRRTVDNPTGLSKPCMQIPILGESYSRMIE